MDNFNPQFQKIGDILVHQKIISADQLNNALTEQKSTKDKHRKENNSMKTNSF